MRLRLTAVAGATGGELVGADVEAEAAAIDSRLVRGGELFVPLVGARDGHDYVPVALAAGAAGTLSAQGPFDAPSVVVDDTLAALHDLTRYARSRLPDQVVGITGSVGKTTVKDLLVAALRQRWRTAATSGNQNNEIGVPLTLLAAPDATEAMVVEMGACAAGDLRLLSTLAQPTIGVVTSVGMAHTETFGSVEEIARAKAELVQCLPPTGTAVLNADDPRVAAMSEDTSAAVVTFGIAAAADVTATEVNLDDGLRASFRLRSPWGDADVRLPIAGRHQVGNALAAATAALVTGVEADDVAAGLAQVTLSPWRMALGRTPSGALVLDDAYNANPLSMASALRALADLPATRRVAVLGTMAELGAVSAREHQAAASLAAELGIRVVAVDEPRYGTEVVSTVEEAQGVLGELGTGDAVLVKGSRVAGLERLAARLRNERRP
ncbi:MAG TPA: UDP-N-acetylmuramoyl-tripeptide--D-alanyl-D-alanine ligase [Acidimicrobiales bacterium]|nr:UDP-N-acetylmuramoyl-tripeptide--D-alanyl-D-alanine ligase [Acidimicrobiales bacterium]